MKPLLKRIAFEHMTGVLTGHGEEEKLCNVNTASLPAFVPRGGLSSSPSSEVATTIAIIPCKDS